MGKATSRERLAANLGKLMIAPGSKLSTALAVEKATAAKGSKIGRSTVQRILTGTTPVNVDYVDTLAKVFGVETWQMLADDLGRTTTSADAPPDLGQSLAGLAVSLNRVAETDHESAIAALKVLVSDPSKHQRVHKQLELLIEDQLATIEEPDGDDMERPPPRPKDRPPAAKKGGGRVKAPIYYGDGNKLQGKLPFALKPKEELVRSKYVPAKESEKDLWKAIEEYPKAKACA